MRDLETEWEDIAGYLEDRFPVVSEEGQYRDPDYSLRLDARIPPDRFPRPVRPGTYAYVGASVRFDFSSDPVGYKVELLFPAPIHPRLMPGYIPKGFLRYLGDFFDDVKLKDLDPRRLSHFHPFAFRSSRTSARRPLGRWCVGNFEIDRDATLRKPGGGVSYVYDSMATVKVWSVEDVVTLIEAFLVWLKAAWSMKDE
jgi:hypothetical protein